MSDLDNNNLTSEEENSGFSPSESDNKSFTADNGSTAKTTGNNDWGQTNYFVKPPRKTPLWPFLLVGAFVLVGIIAIIFMSSGRLDYDQMLKSEAEESAAYVKGSKEHQTQHIAIDKKIVVEVKVNDKHPQDMNHKSTNHCNPNDCKPGGKCDPKDCKPNGKCDPNDCKPDGKCDPKDCKPGGKCDPNDCKPDGKYDPISGKPIHHRSKYHKSRVMNCEGTSIQIVTPKPLRKRIYPKEGKPALQIDAKGLYVLQVYAALSKEDADVKYEEYKNKGAEKVWVSTYTHENVIWYRVRIGDFATKAQADTKARELGITTYWVDRIR